MEHSMREVGLSYSCVRAIEASIYAAFPQAIKAVDHFVKGTQAASAALRITINTGESSFFGEKYKVDTVRQLKIDRHITLG
jgi:hypothetical protein